MTSTRERLHNLFPDLDFDPDELRAKYRHERDKRQRSEGEGQYLEPKGTSRISRRTTLMRTPTSRAIPSRTRSTLP